MSKWIFVITSDIAEFDRRINQNRWPIYNHTPHRSDLKPGDEVVFYMGGTGGQKFLGSGTLSSRMIQGEPEHHVEISDVKVWKKPLPIRPIIQELKFITRKDKKWGVHLQGGVLPLYDDDYKFIILKSRK